MALTPVKVTVKREGTIFSVYLPSNLSIDSDETVCTATNFVAC